MRLLTIKQVVEKTNFSDTTIYNWMKQDYFPKSMQFGNGDRKIARWKEDEIDEWINKHYTQIEASL